LRNDREYKETLWDGIAYAARYGSTPVTAMLGRVPTVTELRAFNDALERILNSEHANRSLTDG